MTGNRWPEHDPDLRPTWVYLGIVAVVLLVLQAGADAATWPADSLRACPSAVARGHEAADTDTALRVCTRVTLAAKRHGLPPSLLVALARVESHYNPGAVSGDGAVGPLQVLARYHCPKRLGLAWCSYDESVKAGAAYLAELVGRWGVRGGLARYRVGESAYRDSAARRAVGENYAGRVLAGVALPRPERRGGRSAGGARSHRADQAEAMSRNPPPRILPPLGATYRDEAGNLWRLAAVERQGEDRVAVLVRVCVGREVAVFVPLGGLLQ